jgi:hypothetical protein
MTDVAGAVWAEILRRRKTRGSLTNSMIVAVGLDRAGLLELHALGYVEPFDIGIEGRWRLTNVGIREADAASPKEPDIFSRRRRRL